MKTIYRLATAALLTLAPVSLAAPAHADEPGSVSFEHGGTTYNYTVVERGSLTILRGVAERGGSRTPFTLRVRGQHVRGQVGMSDVSFPLSEVRSLRAASVIASR